MQALVELEIANTIALQKLIEMHVSKGMSEWRMPHRCHIWRELLLVVVYFTTIDGDLFSAHHVKAKGADRTFIEHVLDSISGGGMHFICSTGCDV